MWNLKKCSSRPATSLRRVARVAFLAQTAPPQGLELFLGYDGIRKYARTYDRVFESAIGYSKRVPCIS